MFVEQVLCGCGGLDGTEISECVSLAISLSQHNFYPKFFAPDVDICGVFNHYNKELDTSGSPRNALVEGARLARSSIKPLCECKTSSGEALIIPGGFGAARTMLDTRLSSQTTTYNVTKFYPFTFVEGVILPRRGLSVP